MKKVFLFLSKLVLYSFFLLILLSGLIYGVGSLYKKELLSYFNTSLSEKISGDLHFEDLRFSLFHPFPSLSVELKGFTVKDSVYKQDVLRADKLFLQIKLIPLLHKELHINSIQIQDAVFAMMKDSSGYSNLSAFRLKNPTLKDSTSSSAKSSPLEFALKKATLKNVVFDFRDEKKNKSIKLAGKHLEISLHKADEVYKLHIKGEVHSDGLNFNPVKGAFLNNKDFDLNLLIDYEIARKFLTILPGSSVASEGQKYIVEGHSDLGTKPPIIQLEIACEDTDYDKALALLNQFLRTKLEKFHALGGISSQTVLQIDTRPGTEPKVWVNFQLKDSKARLRDFEFEHVFLQGLFTNCTDTSLPASNENSKVELKGESLSYMGINCQFQALLDNLKEVDARISASAKGPLSSFNYFLDSTKCKLPSGELDLALSYKGPLDLKKSDNQKLNASINGQLKIHDGQLKMIGKNLEFNKIQTAIVFNNQDVKIEQLNASLNGNAVELKGQIINLLPFLLFPDKDCSAELNLRCPYFNINTLVSNKKTSSKKVTASKKKKPIMHHMESIAEHLSVTLKLGADRVQYRKMNATNVKGLITLDSKALSISTLQMNLPPKGQFVLKGKYLFEEDDANHMELTTNLKDIDATQIFKDFDNFNQKTLTHKQLGGKINGNMSLTCDMDENLIPVQKTLKGYANLQFEDGSINDFEPLRNLSKYIFKERDLMHIRFDDIDTRFLLDGYDIDIERLHVNSSAISLFVEGTYSFKNNTDLGIQIPLSNLKARKEDFYHAEQHSHGNIRLRAKDKDGKVAVSFDQFDKFHKDRRIN